MSAYPQLAASPDDIDYWTHSDWWPVWLVLERWGWPEPQCLEAKRQALLSACERGQVQWRRSDGKPYDDCTAAKIQNPPFRATKLSFFERSVAPTRRVFSS